jgi:quercetin dioxygenase-like cupin family protein
MATITDSTRVEAVATVPAAEGSSVRWLVTGERGGSRSGVIGRLAIRAGTTIPRHAHPDLDEAIFVLSGTGTVSGADGEHAAAPGTLIVSPRGTPHSLSAEETLEALVLYTGTHDPATLTAVEPAPADGESSPQVVDSAGLGRDPLHVPEQGFHHMGSRFLVGETGIGGVELLLGDSAYGAEGKPGGHALHRHPNGEEFIFLRSGTAWHLTPDGRLPMAAGDISFMPAGEWHGVWNDSDTPVLGLFGYLGCSTLAAAGYELPEE